MFSTHYDYLLLFKELNMPPAAPNPVEIAGPAPGIIAVNGAAIFKTVGPIFLMPPHNF